MQRVVFAFEVNAPRADVWAFHANPQNLPRIMPGGMRVLRWDAPMQLGSNIALRLGFGALGLDWLMRVIEHQPPQYYVDEQMRGPWSHWRHTHRFQELDSLHTRVIDEIEFALPVLEIIVARVIMPLMMAHRSKCTRRLLAH